MAVVRMDLDQAQQTIDTMRRTMDEFNSQLNGLSGSVNSLLGAWEGRAQAQFNSAWDEWRNRFLTAVNELQPMISGLETERREMEEADSSSHF
ncbi:MAG: WXG100 family type VII secretion target [Oscillochloris sp.]|nr:WXG100 family type VII secretion target [Oscillochloris sp.]NTV65940.1 WXG100 family type VII secretion target [Oscillochloris sp.]